MKLGDLRRYVVDQAADMADGKASRQTTRILNAALRAVAHAHDWSFYRDRQVIALDVGVAGSYLAVTQGSREFTLDSTQTEVFLQTWVDEGREFLVTGDSGILFTIDHLVGPFMARMHQEWVEATDTVTTYTVLRSKYDLPATTVKLWEVMLSSSRQILVELTPADFDFRKLEQISTTGDPLYYTVRGDQIEVWPALGSSSDPAALLISRQKLPALINDSDVDDTDVDWPDRLADLLERAIDVQVLQFFKASTTLDPALTIKSYGETLARYKSADGVRQPGLTQFSLSPGLSIRQADRIAARRSTLS